MAMLNVARPGLPSAPIEVIRKLFPTDFLIHIGAGRGMGPLARWRQWELARALVVDADPQTRSGSPSQQMVETGKRVTPLLITLAE